MSFLHRVPLRSRRRRLAGRRVPFSRVSHVLARAFAPARFARLIARGRASAGRTSPVRYIGDFSHRCDAGDEPASGCRFLLSHLTTVLQGSSPYQELFQNKRTTVRPPGGDIGTCHEMSCSVMRCPEPPCAPGLRQPPCRRACRVRLGSMSSRPFPACLSGSRTLRNRIGGPGSRLSSTPSLSRFRPCQAPSAGTAQSLESSRAGPSMCDSRSGPPCPLAHPRSSRYQSLLASTSATAVSGRDSVARLRMRYEAT